MRYERLFDYAKSLADITAYEWEEFEDVLLPLRAIKGDVLTRPGEEALHFYIVLEGIFRNYDIDQYGKEYTKIFRGSDEFVGPYVDERGGLAEKIPQYQIASYLGVSSEAFNRLLKKMKSS